MGSAHAIVCGVTCPCGTSPNRTEVVANLRRNASWMHENAINQQQDNCPDYRGLEPGGVLRSVPAKLLAQVFCHECAADAEQRGNNETAWVAARHQQLRDDPDDE